MATETDPCNPGNAVRPGRVLRKRLDVEVFSHAEFARRRGRSSELVGEIVSDKAPLEPETVLQFEKVFGVDASIARSTTRRGLG